MIVKRMLRIHEQLAIRSQWSLQLHFSAVATLLTLPIYISDSRVEAR